MVVKIIVCLVIALIIAFITMALMESELKSQEIKTTAAGYEKTGSFKLSTKNDRYLFKKLEKREKPKETPKES